MVEKQLSQRGRAVFARSTARFEHGTAVCTSTEIDFQLLGHCAPYGKYPAPVIAIGMLAGDLVAIYPGGKSGAAARAIDQNCGYVRHSETLNARLRGFDYRTERLFAYSAGDVRKYEAGQEKPFFANFLKEKSTGCVPAIRRVLERVLCLRRETRTVPD